MTKYRTVKEVVPVITDLPIPPTATADDLTALHSICVEFRAAQSQISAGEKEKEKLKPKVAALAERLALPDRVLGPPQYDEKGNAIESWDLRKGKRETRKVNEDLLRSVLLNQVPSGLTLEIECPPTAMSGVSIIVCPLCGGAGRRKVAGMQAVDALLEQVVEVSVSESWSVWALSPPKQGTGEQEAAAGETTTGPTGAQVVDLRMPRLGQ